MTSSWHSTSMDSVAAAVPFHFPPMSHTFFHGYSNGFQDDSSPGPSQSTPSQRLLSQMLPAQAPPSQPSASRPSQHHRASPSPATASSSFLEAQHASSSTHLHSTHITPHKSSLRLSHPPPPPSSSYMQQVTPQPKRARLDHDSRSTASTTTSPFSSNNNSLLNRSNDSSALTGPLSSPSPSNVRPLSGISRPLPLPPIPSPSHRPPARAVHHACPIPMPQRSIQDFEKLLPGRQPAAVSPQRSDVPRRSVLQAIPPQPILPVPPPRSPVAQHHHLHPLPPAPETLPSRASWSQTGFQSFDLDLDRIAEVQRLDQSRSDDAAEEQSTDSDAAAAHTASRASREHDRISGSLLGHPDRGLPSGSILEVLGPPGSGKSSFVVQYAITERLRALGRARASLTTHGDAVDESTKSEVVLHYSDFTDSCYFTEDFWDAEIARADQVLVIDCEGALSPERLADAAWSAAMSLWAVTHQHQSASEKGMTTEPASPTQQRANLPEAVRRLVAAILAGIHVSHVTSLAGLIALLHSLRPTDELYDGQIPKALPSAMPARTSLILIDTLSYHIRSTGGSSQDRKVVAQCSERIRDMLLRLQKPYEYRPRSELSPEENDVVKARLIDAASKLCMPTVVFTNQLGIRRGRDELQAYGRASSSGRTGMATGSGRSLGKNIAEGEASSMLAPLLNGPKPPQPARARDERPPPSVALCGPEMWDEEEQTAAAQGAPSRQTQQIRGHSAATTPHMGHDRGWPLSFLGQDVWRILLFRHGSFGHRYAQMVSIPPVVQSELASLWNETRQRMRARAAEATRTTELHTPRAEAEAAEHQQASNQPAEVSPEAQQNSLHQSDAVAAPCNVDRNVAEDKDKQMLELLGQLRASLFRWRPFHLTSCGLSS
uniref:Uncharacterized protein n=1 Tax=Ustilago xerochloae TaxID=249492 RepID=H2CZ29_9BASI|nr:hypothetical protein [Ustilago xerochloae]